MFVVLALLTAAAIAIHGYHLGIEDAAIYLPAMKFDLDHGLYPHDSGFFLPQTNPTLIDELVAWTTRATHIPVEWTIFGWHVLSIFGILWGCWRIAKLLFEDERARWAGVAMIAALLTLPVTGTALYLADQHLHPRALATALILLALEAVLPRLSGAELRLSAWMKCVFLVFLAALVHIQMAFFGALLVLFMVLPWKVLRKLRSGNLALFLIPLSTLFQPASPEWREAALSRGSHFLLRWEWYEWLGIFAPMALLWWFSRVARRTQVSSAALREPGAPTVETSLVLERLCHRLVYVAVFAFIGAAITTIPARFVRLTPYQPMRMFHLVYLLMFLIIGGLLGQFVLKNKVWRWLVLFLPLAAGMYFVQREQFPASRHIELPGRDTGNQWVQAFDWIHLNTPTDAYFVLDPHYMSYPGEDFHGFRGLAERGQLADWDKDPGVVLLFPALAPRWHEQVHALDGFNKFTAADLHGLHERFGVDWTVLARPVPGKADPEHQASAAGLISSLECPYQNAAVAVCRIR